MSRKIDGDRAPAGLSQAFGNSLPDAAVVSGTVDKEQGVGRRRAKIVIGGHMAAERNRRHGCLW